MGKEKKEKKDKTPSKNKENDDDEGGELIPVCAIAKPLADIGFHKKILKVVKKGERGAPTPVQKTKKKRRKRTRRDSKKRRKTQRENCARPASLWPSSHTTPKLSRAYLRQNEYSSQSQSFPHARVCPESQHPNTSR